MSSFNKNLGVLMAAMAAAQVRQENDALAAAGPRSAPGTKENSKSHDSRDKAALSAAGVALNAGTAALALLSGQKLFPTAASFLHRGRPAPLQGQSDQASSVPMPSAGSELYTILPGFADTLAANPDIHKGGAALAADTHNGNFGKNLTAGVNRGDEWVTDLLRMISPLPSDEEKRYASARQQEAQRSAATMIDQMGRLRAQFARPGKAASRRRRNLDLKDLVLRDRERSQMWQFAKSAFTPTAYAALQPVPTLPTMAQINAARPRAPSPFRMG